MYIDQSNVNNKCYYNCDAGFFQFKKYMYISIGAENCR